MLFFCVVIFLFFFFFILDPLSLSSLIKESFALKVLSFWIWDQQAIEGNEREAEPVNFLQV